LDACRATLCRRGPAGAALLLVLAAGGCHRRAEQRPPPPAASRPVLKSEAELAAERAAKIASGEIVPASQPVVVETERSRPAMRAVPPPIIPGKDAIQSDVLLVNDTSLTVAEMLYPLRETIEKLRRAQTRTGFADKAKALLRERTRQEIGFVLMHAEATSKLSDPQKANVKSAVDAQLDELLTLEFDGSKARMTAALAEFGLTLDQYRAGLERHMVVRQYMHEMFWPRVSIRRDELIAYYHSHEAQFSTPGTRELQIIEAPFDRFLPPGFSWQSASPQARAQAQLLAMRHIRAAKDALATRPFDAVAREFSRGLHADAGGSWGQLGKPLAAPPYDRLSRLAFEYTEGQVSEPIEATTGWYIVRCGRIVPAQQVSFMDAQDRVRQFLTEEKFNELTSEHLVRLADRATITSLEEFVNAAMRRIESPDWPGRKLELKDDAPAAADRASP
jgi:hypothetical protein